MLRYSKLCLSVVHQFTTKRLAGHSKWANIKHDKAIKDGQKANMIWRYTRMIRIAIQDGGSTNPVNNSYLKTAVEQAVKSNVPMATINNQIKKFNSNDAPLKRYFLEMKTMSRIFLIVEVYTEHFVGLKMNINTVMRKAGQTAFADCKHMFDEFGLVQVTKVDGTFANASEFEDKVTEDAIECDAQEVEDVDFDKKSASFICRPIEVDKVKRLLMDLGYTIDFAEHIFVPHNTVKPTEAEIKTYETLKQKLSQVDGVENIYDNVELSSD